MPAFRIMTLLSLVILIESLRFSFGIGSGFEGNLTMYDCTAADNSVRLVGGSSDSNGRLEVCYNGTWSTVCDMSFCLNDGEVVCKQLGFFGVLSLTNEFEPGIGDILLCDLDCKGTENSLSECSRAEFFIGNSFQPCQHYRDVGVICRPHKDECTNGAISYFDNNEFSWIGVLQLCVHGLWGLVSSIDFFDIHNGRVACRQLGFDYFLVAHSVYRYYPISYLQSVGLRISWIIDVHCLGNESNLFDCEQGNETWSMPLSTVSEIAVLYCYDDIQLLTNSTTITLGPDRIEDTVTFTCIASTTFFGHWKWIFGDKIVTVGINDGYRIIEDTFYNSTFTTGTLEIINPRRTDEGSYQCLVEYSFFDNGNANQTHYLELKAELSINASGSHILNCELTGYILSNTASSVKVEWFRDGDSLQTTDGQYSITVSNTDRNMIVTGNGTRVPSIISTLYIHTRDIAGNYNCTMIDGNSVLFQNITLDNNEVSPSSAIPLPGDNNIASDLLISVIAIGVIVFFITLICCVFIVSIFVIKRKSKRLDSNFRNFSLDDEHMKKNLQRMNTGIQREKLDKLHLSSCLIDSSDVKLMEKVGQGEFGIVYRGIYRTESSVVPVAIKTIKGLYSESQLVDELFVEADKMKSFDHLHVLSLTGICVGLLESPCIVMPFMSNGSLLSYLRREANDITINEIADENVCNSVLKHLLSICLQVAKGMDYLSQQKFIHRDLAARNCMISSEGIIKIADFGLAEDIYTTVYFKRPNQGSDESVKLPLKWMALESIHLGKYDVKTDVWSYGVLCWEVFNGGKTPYPGSTPKEIVTMLDNGERLTKPTNTACTDEVYSMMLSCWEKSPESRPHFFELVEKINELLVPLADYMKMSLD